ncbi:YdbL family protein [Thermodesulfobacteriota bacterium]
MKKYSMFYAIIALFTLLIFSAEGNCFAGADDIKARMQQRLPTIVNLKSDGLVGENNKGYLEFVPGAAQKEAGVISAENKDRESVYGAIAKQQGTSQQLVGERRANQIGQKASPGSWLQDPSGKWYRK